MQRQFFYRAAVADSVSKIGERDVRLEDGCLEDRQIVSVAGRLEGWKAGRLEGWKDGRMKAGRLEGWKTNSILVCNRPSTRSRYLNPSSHCSISPPLSLPIIPHTNPLISPPPPTPPHLSSLTSHLAPPHPLLTLHALAGAKMGQIVGACSTGPVSEAYVGGGS
jgi:hypothetical protein